MKPRILVLALMSSSGLFAVPAQAAADCNQLFVYAVQQFCSVAPNGQSLCQPFGLVGPAPSCVMPGTPPSLATLPLAPASPQAVPYNPYLNGGTRSPNPFLTTPGVSAVPYVPFQPFALPGQAAPVMPPAASAPAVAPPAPTPATPAPVKPVAVDKPAPAASVSAAPAKPAPAVLPPAATPGTAPVAPPPSPTPHAAALAPLAPPAVAAPTLAPSPAPARPVNPYLIHSGISVSSPFAPAAPTPATKPAPIPAPALKPVPAPPAPVVEAPKPALPPVRPPEASKPAAAALPVTPPAPPVPAPATETRAAPSEAVVLFRFNSSRLTPAARKLLDDWLASAPKGMKIYVTGHADRIGSARYNKKLSLRRAKAVRTYLVSKGLSARSIQVASKGYAAPVKACEGKVSRAIIVCLAPNRRVEVKP